MNESFKKKFAKFIIVVILLILIPQAVFKLCDYIVSKKRVFIPLPVSAQYRDAYNATCGIFAGPKVSSGVLLDTGYIITSMHGIDVNRNRHLDSSEKNVRVEFYHKNIAFNYSGTVIYGDMDIDIAIIATPNSRKSSVKLMSNKDYENVLTGDRIFAIGLMIGRTPPHLTTGTRSTDSENLYDRASLSIFYGNSGGGVFDTDSGELIGIANRIKFNRRMLVPSWGEYLPPNEIRKKLGKVGLLSVVDKEYRLFNPLEYTITYLLIGALTVGYLVRRKRNLR